MNYGNTERNFLKMITIQNLNKSFDKQVLENISINVSSGEFVSILGPSGSGKTTLLNCISGFETVDSGRIKINGKIINDIPSNKRNIGMVFQDYNLFPHMTALENVEFPLKIKQKHSKLSAMDMLDKLGLSEFYYKYPTQLSGGQQQRVALARALVYDPEILLMDEPLGSLDLKLRNEIGHEIKKLQKKLNQTTLYVTHDLTEAFTLSDKIILIFNGKVCQIDTPENIYKSPANISVKHFIESGLDHVKQLKKVLKI